VVILALPDRALGTVAHHVVPQLKPGALVMCLDPAAPQAGELPERGDIGYFVTHPCHPPVFNDEVGEARKDYFGGVKAKQHIVCALQQGTEAHYKTGETLACAMYAPVMTVAPDHGRADGASRTGDGGDGRGMLHHDHPRGDGRSGEARRPEAAARDFLLGHVNIPLAIVFARLRHRSRMARS
jgi:hypothetical protein